VARGFVAHDITTLVTDAPATPERASRTATVRRLTQADLAEVAEIRRSQRPPEVAVAAYDAFSEQLERRYLALADAGHGALWGAFEAERCRAVLGLFMCADGSARYQNVVTHRDAQQRGLATRLVSEAGRRTLAETGATRLVICADTDGAAARLYQRCNFTAIERQGGVCRRPVTDTR
jgi:ribosomal protein S18 acetylase RimI-like enzyme